MRRQMHGQALQAPRRPARVTVAPMGRDEFLSAPIPGQEPWPVNRQPDRIDVRFRSCLRSPVPICAPIVTVSPTLTLGVTGR